MKKGLSGPGIRSYGAVGSPSQPCSAGLLDMWAGNPPPSSDQCTWVPEGCDSTKGTRRNTKKQMSVSTMCWPALLYFKRGHFGLVPLWARLINARLYSSCSPCQKVHLWRLLQSGGSGLATWNRDGAIFSLKEQTDASSMWLLTILTCDTSGKDNFSLLSTKRF